MKSTILIFIIVLLFSCENKSKKSKEVDLQTFNLTIINEKSNIPNIVLSHKLAPGNIDSTLNWSYDSINKRYFKEFKNLPRGKYIYETQSIFTKKLQVPIFLNKNKTIIAKNNFDIELVDAISHTELLNADTIEVIFDMNGCYTGYTDKTLFIKNKKTNNYRLIHSNNRNYYDSLTPIDFNAEIKIESIEKLFQTQQQYILKRKELAKKGSIIWSTNSYDFYILANNKLFKNTSYSNEDFPFYEKFIEYLYYIHKKNPPKFQLKF